MSWEKVPWVLEGAVADMNLCVKVSMELQWLHLASSTQLGLYFTMLVTFYNINLGERLPMLQSSDFAVIMCTGT